MDINQYKKIIDTNLNHTNCDVKMQSVFALINSDLDLSPVDRQDLLKYLTYSAIDILKGYKNYLETDITVNSSKMDEFNNMLDKSISEIENGKNTTKSNHRLN